jgi:L-iditol 2-dehydrogenase
VAVFEPREVRRQAALTIGAAAADPTSWACTPNFDVVIDTSGSAKALDSSTSLLKVGARLILVGLGSSEIRWPLGPFDVSTSFAYNDTDFAAAVEHIVSGRVRLGQLLTHTYSLDDTGVAIDASANNASVIKAAVKPA